MRTERVPHPAIQLWDAGYAPYLIPLRPGEKAPRDSGWPLREYRREEIESAVLAGCNFGIKHSGLPAVDCDVADPEIATALRSLLRDIFPDAPCRIGAAPKFALAFRAGAPFAKSVLTLRKADGCEFGKIELRSGAGHQFVVAGVHPLTHLPYVWEDRGRSGGAELLAERSLESLPQLGAATIDGIIIPRITEMLATRGISLERTGSGRTAESVPDQSGLLAPDIETLRRVVGLIPNGAAFDDRSAWIRMAAAIKAAGDIEGFDVWAEWCGRWQNGSNSLETIRSTWDSLRPPYSVGFHYLEDLARPFGHNVAQREFTALDASPYVGKETHTSATPPLPTEGERLAALTGDAMRVLYIESATLNGAELIPRHSVLEAALLHGDPLSQFFVDSVLREADGARFYATDLPRFGRMLGSRMSGKQGWLNLSVPERDLLTRAGFLFVAAFPALNALRDASAIRPVDLSEGPTTIPYLVEGLIPEGARAMLAGDPGGGKTFLALELSACIATTPKARDEVTGVPVQETFASRSVRHGRALYFASEGVASIQARLSARAHARGAPEHLFVFPVVPLLSSPSQAFNTVVQASRHTSAPDAPAIALITIDILRDAITDSDSKDDVAAQATAAMHLIAQATGATVLVIHHAPRSEPTRGRGSTHWTAAMDFCAASEASKAGFTMTVTKHRNAPSGDKFYWHIDSQGVVRDGAASALTGDSTSRTGAAALAVARVLQSAPASGISRRELARVLRYEHVDLFGANDGAADSLRLRGIAEAIANDWVVEKRTKILCGSTAPPSPLSSAPADLTGLL